MSVCTRSLCILARLPASSRCNCSPATRRIRCSSLRRKGLLDTGHPLRKTPNTETIFVGACSIETIATDRWRCLVVGKDPTDREIYVYILYVWLSVTNECPWTGKPFRAVAVRSPSETLPLRFRLLFGIAE